MNLERLVRALIDQATLKVAKRGVARVDLHLGVLDLVLIEINIGNKLRHFDSLRDVDLACKSG